MARKAAFEADTQSDRHERDFFGSLPIEPNFFDSISLRETIESIAVAIILAMVFKTLEAEAYVIPTGSMAPTLMGQHVEVQCDECGYWYRTGANGEGPSAEDRNAQRNPSVVSGVRCPMCHRDQVLTRLAKKETLNFSQSEYDPNEESFSGDRIIVSKVEYIFREPRRWDVIVFKYPGNGKQNYIKRLVGLPNELLAISNGDVYVRNAENQDVTNDDPHSRAQLIARKPPEKLASIMIPVEDTHYFSPTMRAAGLPASWVPWTGPLQLGDQQPDDSLPWVSWCANENGWQVDAPADEPASFTIQNSAASDQQFHWLRFRQMVPSKADWNAAEQGEKLSELFLNHPGTPVTDYYCYSDSNEDVNYASPIQVSDPTRIGTNWVGDLVMEADLELIADGGTIALDAVEGGVHFVCSIDVATGKATLRTVSDLEEVKVDFESEDGRYGQDEVTFATPLKGAGSYEIRFANADDRITLWVDGAEVAIPGDGHYSRQGPLYPVCLPNDAADAQPLAIGAQGAAIKVNRLQVFRDLFYNDYRLNRVADTNLAIPEGTARQYLLRPDIWSDPRYIRLYQDYASTASIPWDKGFPLGEDQFFPMGDNSPSSSDARVWEVDHYVDRKMLIGKALMVYWPHTWNSPKYWPNFGRMRVIR